MTYGKQSSWMEKENFFEKSVRNVVLTCTCILVEMGIKWPFGLIFLKGQNRMSWQCKNICIAGFSSSILKHCCDFGYWKFDVWHVWSQFVKFWFSPPLLVWLICSVLSACTLMLRLKSGTISSTTTTKLVTSGWDEKVRFSLFVGSIVSTTILINIKNAKNDTTQIEQC